MELISPEHVEKFLLDPKFGYHLAVQLANDNDLNLKEILLYFIDLNPIIVRHIPFSQIWDKEVLLLLARKKQFSLLGKIIEMHNYMKPMRAHQMIVDKVVFTDELCRLMIRQDWKYSKYFPKEFLIIENVVPALVDHYQDKAFDKRKHIMNLIY